MAKKQQTESHRFFCIECGSEGIPIQRNSAKKKEVRHLKELFCIFCNKHTNHCEIEPNGHYTVANFKEDFNNDVFKDKRRKDEESN